MVKNDNYYTIKTGSGVREIWVPPSYGGGGGGNVDISNLVTKQEIKNYYTKAEIDKLNKGDVLFTDPRQVPTTIGGITKGRTFDKVPLVEVTRDLLYPYQDPSIASFSTTKTSLTIGETLTSPITVSWNITNTQNVKQGSIDLKLDNKKINTDSLGFSATNKTFVITPITLNSIGSKQLVLSLRNTNGKEITKTVTITWYNTIIYGTIDKIEITSDDVQLLTKLNANSIGRRYAFPANGYKWFLIPNSWTATNFVDSDTQFEVPMREENTLNITNPFGVEQTYRVYRSVNRLGGAINMNIN